MLEEIINSQIYADLKTKNFNTLAKQMNNLIELEKISVSEGFNVNAMSRSELLESLATFLYKNENDELDDDPIDKTMDEHMEEKKSTEPPMQIFCCSDCGVPLYAGKMLLINGVLRMSPENLKTIHPKALYMKHGMRPTCPDCNKPVDLCLN